MKILLILMTAFLMQVSASTFAQKITLKEKQASLVSIFEKINKQSGVDFLVNIDLLSKAKLVSIDVNNEELSIVLDKIFEGQPLEYTLKDKAVVVTKKESSFLDRIVDRFNTIDVSGQVVDVEGRRLAGASITVKGKGGKTASTGADGTFYLQGVDEDATLVISFIGYVPKEVKASTNLENVVLELSTSKLDEVQVIAYGTTTQRLSTGNVTTIKADVIQKQPVNNPLLALQGRVPGLFIEQATGYAGTGVKVRIQGTNSLENGNDPLYIVDGIPYTSQLLVPSIAGTNPIVGSSGGTNSTQQGSPLNFINPADIESIDILKDADATAIYGSRAANGAILITTKRGKAGELRVNANLQNGWGRVSRKLDLMNSEEYLSMRKEALRNDGIINPGVTDYDLNGLWDVSRYTNWQEELIGGTAKYRDFQASISGGGNNTTFLVGAGYHNETSVIPGDYADTKSSIHFNMNSSSSNQRFKIQFSGSFMRDNNLLPQVDLTQTALNLAPVAPPLFNSDGTLNYQRNSTGAITFSQNPMTFLNGRFRNETDNLIGNGNLSYSLLPGLVLKSGFGFNSLKSNIIDYRIFAGLAPETLRFAQRQTNFRNSTIRSWIVEPQLNYNRTFAQGKLDVLLGSTMQKENRDASAISATGFNTDQVMEDVKSALTLTPGGSYNSIYKYYAFFARINYNWDDTYILNLTARRDGSSRFGFENQYHNFGAIGAAWIFSSEKVIKENLRFLSFGKLRGSFGTTGSDNIPDYNFLSLYDAIPFISSPYQGAKGYAPTGLTNPYLQWEETKKLQFGLDLGFLKDRILFNTNYSRNRSSNQLLAYLLPIQTGFDYIQKNLPAIIQNTGWEFTLSTVNVKTSKLGWTTSINLTLPKNKLIDFEDFQNSGYASAYAIGQSVNIQKKYRFLGVDPSNGQYQFADKNGNPTLNPVPNGMPDNDATKIINTDPKFYGGIQNSLTLAGFEIDILFQFAKQMGQNYFLGSYASNAPGAFLSGLSNLPSWQLNHWEKAGDISSIEKYSTMLSNSKTNAYYYSDAVWGDASYIRLKNISVSWNLPKSWINTMHLQNFKLYLQGQNLLTITNYYGLDPETKSSMSLPPLRVITMGLNIIF